MTEKRKPGPRRFHVVPEYDACLRGAHYMLKRFNALGIPYWKCADCGAEGSTA